MRVRCWLLVIALCGSGASAQAQEATEIVEVLLFAEDGTVMMGYWYVAEGEDPTAPAVLLLHMLSGRAQDWLPLSDELALAGIHALAIDLRGHGESGGARDWTLAQRDVAKWWHWFAAHQEVDAMAVVGASIGANLALLGCAEWADCRGAIALSPGLDYRGLQPQLALEGAAARHRLR